MPFVYTAKKWDHIAKMGNLKIKTKKKNGKGNSISKVQNIIPGKSHVYDFPPLDVEILLHGLKHKMDIDFGSLHSVMSSDTFVKLWQVNPPNLLPVSDQSLRTCNSKN